MTLLAIIVLAIMLFALLVSVSYNSFIHRKNAMDYAYHGLQTTIQKRHELLPQLAAMVETSAQFEGMLLQEAQKMLQPPSIKNLPPSELVRQENAIVKSMRDISRELLQDSGARQHKHLMHLQKSIVEVEAQVSAAKRAYNATVMDYNNAIEMFPTTLFASMLNQQAVNPLELEVVDADHYEL